MDAGRYYSKAPITEAIIDLRVKLPGDANTAQLERCGVEQQESYPKKTRLNYSVGHMELGERLSTSAATTHVGYQFQAHS